VSWSGGCASWSGSGLPLRALPQLSQPGEELKTSVKNPSCKGHKTVEATGNFFAPFASFAVIFDRRLRAIRKKLVMLRHCDLAAVVVS
jgi:hypothetical protein